MNTLFAVFLKTVGGTAFDFMLPILEVLNNGITNVLNNMGESSRILLGAVLALLKKNKYE